MELIKNEDSIGVYRLLEMPLYLMSFIAICRIIALIVLWMPNWKRLKEWAFAGLVIDVVGAGYCLVVATNSITGALFPLLVLVVIFIFYSYNHKINQ